MSLKCLCYLRALLVTLFSASTSLLGAQRLPVVLPTPTLPTAGLCLRALNYLPDGLRWLPFICQPLSARKHKLEFELRSERSSRVLAHAPIPVEQLRARPSGYAPTTDASAGIVPSQHGCRYTPTAECRTGPWLPQRGCQLGRPPCKFFRILISGCSESDHRNCHPTAQSHGSGQSSRPWRIRCTAFTIAIAAAFMVPRPRCGTSPALRVASQCIKTRRHFAAD